MTIIFPISDKRTSFESALVEAKEQLAASIDKRPPPEFINSIPIRKTRSGLQFSCASPTLGYNQFGFRDIWVCNSDGYVGQVCVLSLESSGSSPLDTQPTVTSCNGVCNARILCVASIPPFSGTDG